MIISNGGISMRLENKTTEFKREYTADLKYAVVAFANTDGGKIYIGINDDGSVQGVQNTDATMLQVTNMIRDVVRPDVTMFTECAVEEVEGKPVVVVTIQRGTARPYYLSGKGVRPEGVYIRQGASSVPASETAILNMIKETSGDCYEDARSLNQQLTFDKAENYFVKRKLPFGDQQKRTLTKSGDSIFTPGIFSRISQNCMYDFLFCILYIHKNILSDTISYRCNFKIRNMEIQSNSPFWNCMFFSFTVQKYESSIPLRSVRRENAVSVGKVKKSAQMPDFLIVDQFLQIFKDRTKICIAETMDFNVFHG